MTDTEKANRIENRLIDFAVRIIKVADSLPKSPAGRHISGQVLRSGTAPNYAEGRGAESRADFVHKLKIAVKELNERQVWLKMICRASLLQEELLTELIAKNCQLCRILNASVTTARSTKTK